MSWHQIDESGDHSSETLHQYFHAYDCDARTVVFSDRINSNVRQPSIDSFFVKDWLLYYVKDRHILTAHTFTGS